MGLILPVLAACSNPDGSPAFATSPSLVLTADPDTIAADGTSTSRITAVVSGGNQVVRFETTKGTLSGTSAKAVNGVATVTLTSATTAGTAVVTGISGTARATVSVTFR